ncbi:MAG: hypothetical protein J07HQX50_00586 [Haloquadratum sp. J07HQX50]|nr:MAG: hypothetical protein J07HQX50_00586 [Haloquadratum sp. J07HQX50]
MGVTDSESQRLDSWEDVTSHMLLLAGSELRTE